MELNSDAWNGIRKWWLLHAIWSNAHENINNLFSIAICTGNNIFILSMLLSVVQLMHLLYGWALESSYHCLLFCKSNDPLPLFRLHFARFRSEFSLDLFLKRSNWSLWMMKKEIEHSIKMAIKQLNRAKKLCVWKCGHWVELNVSIFLANLRIFLYMESNESWR